MEVTHKFGGFDIDGVLVAKSAFFNSKNETEPLNVLMEVTEQKARLGPFLKVMQFKRLKIAYKNVPRKFGLLYPRKVVKGLLLRLR